MGVDIWPRVAERGSADWRIASVLIYQQNGETSSFEELPIPYVRYWDLMSPASTLAPVTPHDDAVGRVILRSPRPVWLMNDFIIFVSVTCNPS